MYENVHINLALVLLFIRIEVECGEGLLLDFLSDFVLASFIDIRNSVFIHVGNCMKSIYTTDIRGDI